MREPPPRTVLRSEPLPQPARPLPTPAELRAEQPVPETLSRRVDAARATIRAALHGRDRDRLVVVVGPCSLHDVQASLEYAARLEAVARRLPELVVVMRTYFEKPRTTIGWKGLVRDPHLDGSGDVATGLRRARSLLGEITALGLPCAGELLDPLVAPYLTDLLSWAAIGARTTESQVHREMASGLPMPVGFKNGTDGELQAALDAIEAAGHRHHVLGLDEAGRLGVRETPGNPDRHLVLRGGRGGPNHGPGAVREAARALGQRGIARGVLVDCSHANSGKRPERQAAVCRAVLDQVVSGEPGLLGLMLESHLRPGHQEWTARPRRHGVSITDACIGWEETERLLEEIARTASAEARRLRPDGPQSPPRSGRSGRRWGATSREVGGGSGAARRPHGSP